MSDEKQIHPFIDYLYSLSQGHQHRGALADLRRGLSESPGTAPVMFPYVARWVPEDARQSWKEKVYYLVAALFAYYQSGSKQAGKQRITSGNFGEHCLRAKAAKKQSESYEMRFASLLKSNVEDLPVMILTDGTVSPSISSASGRTVSGLIKSPLKTINLLKVSPKGDNDVYRITYASKFCPIEPEP